MDHQEYNKKKCRIRAWESYKISRKQFNKILK